VAARLLRSKERNSSVGVKTAGTNAWYAESGPERSKVDFIPIQLTREVAGTIVVPAAR
jgi:hypothetical protein